MGSGRRLGALAAAGATAAGLLAQAPLHPAGAATQTFTATGGGVPAAVAAFTAALGGANNGGTATPFPSGFRQITWDGVPVTGANAIVSGAVGDVANNQFQARGVIFSDDNAVATDGFNAVNGDVSTADFPAFSPTRIFAPYNDNTVEVHFVFASTAATTPVRAASKGLGVVFQDVEEAGLTQIEFFKGTTSLGVFNPPVGGHGVQSFLGVVFDTPRVSRAVITLGDAHIFNLFGAPGDPTSPAGLESEGDELVTTDDFLYGEPMCTRSLGAVSSPTIVAANGDVVCLTGTTVNGSVVGNPGAVLIIKNAFVAGNVSTNGADGLWLCGSTVRGSVTAQNATGFVRIGDFANEDGVGCNPNNIRGDVSVLNGRGGFQVSGNQVGANVTLNDNRLGGIRLQAPPPLAPAGDDGHEVEGNTIGGQLTCLRNSPDVTDDGHPNIVTGAVNCEFFVID